MGADLVRAWAILAPINSNDVDPFEMAAEYHPSDLDFVLYYVIDVDACDDDDAGDGGATHLSMHHASDCHVIDMFLY